MTECPDCGETNALVHGFACQHERCPMTDKCTQISDNAVHLGILDDMDHEAKYDTDAEYRKSELRIQALGAAISRRDLHAVEQAYAAIRDKFYSHGRQLPTGFGWINSATEKGSSSQLGPQQEMCDRAAIVVARMGHWVPEEKRSELAAHIRIALDTEVEAGGPYLNNGWNKPVAITSGQHHG